MDLNKLEWLNPPAGWRVTGYVAEMQVSGKTDFWRKTYGAGLIDSGHFGFVPVKGDFVLEVKAGGAYASQADQVGLMVRVDETTWLKWGIEYVNGQALLAAVFTRDYSDGSTHPLPEGYTAAWFRVARQGHTLGLSYSLDGQTYELVRYGYLAPVEEMRVGLTAAAPEGSGFTARFEGLDLRPV